MSGPLCIVGIDPGLRTGALAIIRYDNETLIDWQLVSNPSDYKTLADAPYLADLYKGAVIPSLMRIGCTWRQPLYAVETYHYMGQRSANRYAFGTAEFVGYLVGHLPDARPVAPEEWREGVIGDKQASSDYIGAVLAATGLVPDGLIEPYTKEKREHLWDALGIALYLRRMIWYEARIKQASPQADTAGAKEF